MQIEKTQASFQNLNAYLCYFCDENCGVEIAKIPHEDFSLPLIIFDAKNF